MSLKKSYNKIASHFSKTRNHPWKEFELFKPYLKKDMNILDVGCGNGRLVNFLKPYIENYIGIDISSGLLEKARENHPEYNFKKTHMEDFCDDENTFDAIFPIASFHHLATKKLRIQTLQNFHKMLKKDGIICMTNWNLWQKKYKWIYIKSYLFSWLRGKKPRDLFIPWRDKNKNIIANRYYYSFLKSEIVGLVEKAGFEILFCEYTRGNEICGGKFGAYNLVLVGRKILTNHP